MRFGTDQTKKNKKSAKLKNIFFRKQIFSKNENHWISAEILYKFILIDTSKWTLIDLSISKKAERLKKERTNTDEKQNFNYYLTVKLRWSR